MKRKKKVIILFFSVFFLTLLVGSAVLMGYQKYKQNKENVLETAAQNETSKMDGMDLEEKSSNGTETEDENGASEKSGDFMELPGAGAKMDSQGIDAQKKGDLGNGAEGDDKDLSNSDNSETGQAVLAFGGDICFYDSFSNMGTLKSRGGRMSDVISADLLSEMQNADICMVNNEFPYSNRGEPLAEKTYTFRSNPENVKLLSQMGVDLVGVANNHAYDYGEMAFLDTLDTLDDAGILRVGGGKNLEEASKPVYFEVNGIRIGYLAATQIERNASPDTKGATAERAGVLRCYTEAELNHFLDLIQETKKECDVLVVFIHWGTESTDQLDWAQPYQADLISKSGADLIVGAHPHVLQGLDVVNGVPVVYSLGNYWFNSKTMDTMLLKVKVEKEGVKEICLIPALQSGCMTNSLSGSEKQRVLSYLQSLSQNVSISEDGIVSW